MEASTPGTNSRLRRKKWFLRPVANETHLANRLNRVVQTKHGAKMRITCPGIVKNKRLSLKSARYRFRITSRTNRDTTRPIEFSRTILCNSTEPKTSSESLQQVQLVTHQHNPQSRSQTSVAKMLNRKLISNFKTFRAKYQSSSN